MASGSALYGQSKKLFSVLNKAALVKHAAKSQTTLYTCGEVAQDGE